MTLSELGSLGELVGGIAVIGSLIYLATQVRQATQWQRIESFQGALGRVNDWHRSIATNGDVARIYLDGCADFNSLDPAERARFHSLLVEMLIVCEMMYRMGGTFLDTPTLSARDRSISNLFEHAGIKIWWQNQGRSVFAEDFRDYVERVAAAQQADEADVE